MAEADPGRSCEQIGTAPQRVPSGPGLHRFRFVVRAGLRGGLCTQVTATKGLSSFSLSCG